MEELTSPLAKVIESYELDSDVSSSLDTLVNKLIYFNSLLEYDPDYDIQVYLENSLSNESQLEEQEDEPLPLYPHLRKYGVELIRRYGIFLKPNLILSDMIAILSSIEEFINLDREYVNEVKDERGNTIDDDLISFASLFDQYTSVTEEEFLNYVDDMNDKIMDYLNYSDVEENVEDFDMLMINKLQVVNKELLNAPIIKELMKLGNVRYPEINQYLPMFTKVTKVSKSTNEELMNIFLVLMHVDKDFEIKYDSRYEKDVNYYMKVLEDFIAETHNPVEIEKMLRDPNVINKVRGLKL